MPDLFSPGNLIRTDGRRSNGRSSQGDIWNRISPPPRNRNRMKFEIVGRISPELGEPVIYLRSLPEDDRFAEILLDGQVRVVRKEVLVAL